MADIENKEQTPNKPQAKSVGTQWLARLLGKPANQEDIKIRKTNLVFQGGGVKGVAYLGALKVLDSQGILEGVDRVGGTSSGAIVGMLLGLGYSVNEMQTHFASIDFKKWLDSDWSMPYNMVKTGAVSGMYKGEEFHSWVKAMVAIKAGSPDATFEDIATMYKKAKEGDLKFFRDKFPEPGRAEEIMANAKNFREMHFMTTRLNGGAEIMSHEATPDVAVADAVRASMSIPFFFRAHQIKGRLYVDGSAVSNYPVTMFDDIRYKDKPRFKPLREVKIEDDEYMHRHAVEQNLAPVYENESTLGFKLDNTDGIAGKLNVISREVNKKDNAKAEKEPEIKGIVSYVTRLGGILASSQQAYAHMYGGEQPRTCYINSLGVRTTNFKITDDEKKYLMASGMIGATEMIDRIKYRELSKQGKRDKFTPLELDGIALEIVKQGLDQHLKLHDKKKVAKLSNDEIVCMQTADNLLQTFNNYLEKRELTVDKAAYNATHAAKAAQKPSQQALG